MELEEYEKIAGSTDVSNKSLQFYIDGMTEESGEIVGVLKRVRRGDYDEKLGFKVSEEIENLGVNYILITYPEILSDLLDEIGDREWYTIRFLSKLGLKLPDIWIRNATKVKRRKKNHTIRGKGDER